ncbi:hypothetical protein [Mesorhizobium sp. B2-4-17]|uniref:beta strand repeat-containing protein n=1 Tax=Mesorhizobium sp. B2-4-17 TaxID=2589932 RepID=UPI001AEEB8D4|nr:hypothetical protein [Mesorhizobium sp. B2-4-17]
MNITGATASTYTVAEADEGHLIRVVETATDSDGGPTVTSTSAPTASVTDTTLAFTSQASISGTAKEGSVLTAVNGSLNDSDAAVTAYQWQTSTNGTTWSNVSGATSQTYTAVEADEGHFLRVVETATDADGGPSTTSTSAATTAVTEISLMPTITAGTHSNTGNSGQVTFIVTFSEAVATVVAGDFTLFGTATTGGNAPTISSVTGTGASYTVTVAYPENKDAGLSLGLNFVNTGGLVHDTETGESGNLAVATNITTAQFSSLAPAGVAGSPINLALTDPPADASDTITLTITGVQPDWSLNTGIQNSDGSWTVHTSDPASLAITTSAGFAGAAVIHVAETWTNADGSIGSAIVTDNVEAYTPGSPIFAWSGDDVLTGSHGKDLFVFSQPIGNDTVHSFDTAADKIDLIGYSGFQSFADVQAHLADDGNGNAVIALGDGQSITLDGVHSSALTDGDFAFDQTPVVNNAGTMTVGDGAMLPLSGTINNSGLISLDSAGSDTLLQLIQHGITLQGGGQVVLSDSDSNVISGTGADIILTNADDTISGAGQLGGGLLSLNNQGTIIATGTHALVIDTGANTTVNSGTLEATGSGGLMITGALANSGLLWANGGNITIEGQVTGTGEATIGNLSKLEFGAASSTDVTFAQTAAGTLQLDDSFDFSGRIGGITNDDKIDLGDILFGAGTSAAYQADPNGDGGTLTVTDGAHNATLHLLGIFDAHNFTLVDDGAGRTVVQYGLTASGVVA